MSVVILELSFVFSRPAVTFICLGLCRNKSDNVVNEFYSPHIVNHKKKNIAVASVEFFFSCTLDTDILYFTLR